MDTDRDDLDELHKFERRPLYTEVHFANGKSFRILGVHLKSKGIFNALEWAAWWAKAEGNRKKLLAQCYRLRSKFLDVYLADNATKDIPLIVCGDINDGPGFDASEMKLMASGVETLMGSIWKPALTMGNVLYDGLAEKDQNSLDFEDLYTASFRDPIIDGSYMRVWIDHILYSRNLAGWVSDGKIWREMRGGERIYRKYPTGSDHFPVTCQIALE
jgi:endonuclease/exonuclease/phosphatase family metal-dependent hydrolase